MEKSTARVAGLRAEVLPTVQEAATLIASLLKEACALGYGVDELHGIRLACEEAFANAFRHGNANTPGKSVRASWKVDDSEFLIIIEDQGSGFDPKSVPDPTSPEGLLRTNGRGLLLMKKYMNVELLDRGNVVRMSRPRGWRPPD